METITTYEEKHPIPKKTTTKHRRPLPVRKKTKLIKEQQDQAKYDQQMEKHAKQKKENLKGVGKDVL